LKNTSVCAGFGEPKILCRLSETTSGGSLRLLVKISLSSLDCESYAITNSAGPFKTS